MLLSFSGVSTSNSMGMWLILTEISMKVLHESTVVSLQPVSNIVVVLKLLDSPQWCFFKQKSKNLNFYCTLLLACQLVPFSGHWFISWQILVLYTGWEAGTPQCTWKEEKRSYKRKFFKSEGFCSCVKWRKSRYRNQFWWPRGYKTQLSMKFQLPIKDKMMKNKDFSYFQLLYLWAG